VYEHLNHIVRRPLANGTVSSEVEASTDRQHPSADTLGGRVHQLPPQYRSHISQKIDWSTLQGSQSLYSRTIVQETAGYPKIVPGDCKVLCDAEPRCKIYQENKPLGKTALYDVARCHLILADVWAETEMPTFHTSLVTDRAWNTFTKTTNEKPPTWMHAPIHLANPVSGGYDITSDISSTRGDVTAGIPTGRRLDGVY